MDAMSRDDAVRAAAEALRIESLNYANAAWATRWAAAAVDAAAPHLTADLVRERDEALAMVDEKSDMGHAAADAWQAAAEQAVWERDEALAEVERLRDDFEALCDTAESREAEWWEDLPHRSVSPAAIRAVLRGDQP